MQTPDEIIHQPVRLKIMAALNTLGPNQWLEFVSLRAIVKTTDGNLGAHLVTLESALYVRIKKDFAGKKPRTRICLSTCGRDAFARYVATLHAILAIDSLGPEDDGSSIPPNNNQ
ncbi:transcriptional regulator [Halopseudomonas pelagia]|uniref:winged helix-turn-helix domain-containing protein n=1 Tax=Halopseudomonas pelagia TaxID=553151 RepID=UPI0030D7DC79|tara:strand:- start:113 stop:457 length:345 start_codon:yes stop_codon:yes gene_type:complete